MLFYLQINNWIIFFKIIKTYLNVAEDFSAPSLGLDDVGAVIDFSSWRDCAVVEVSFKIDSGPDDTVAVVVWGGVVTIDPDTADEVEIIVVAGILICSMSTWDTCGNLS